MKMNTVKRRPNCLTVLCQWKKVMVPLKVWVREFDITCHSCGSPVWGTTTTCCPDGVGSISFTPAGQCKPATHNRLCML